MAYHPDIRALEDPVLVRAMVLVSRHNLFPELTLSPWEQTFLSETPTWWAKHGFITWKQRRSARSLLSKVTRELERRRALGTWIKEARQA